MNATQRGLSETDRAVLTVVESLRQINDDLLGSFELVKSKLEPSERTERITRLRARAGRQLESLEKLNQLLTQNKERKRT